MVLLVLLVYQVQQGHKVNQALQQFKAVLVLLVIQDRQVVLVLQDRVQQEVQVLKAEQVQQDQ